MPAVQDPNFGLSTGYDLGESGWKPGYDSDLKKLGATMFLHVISATTTAQPGSPAGGDRYIVPTGATGTDWSGEDGNVAVYNVTTWEFYTPSKGWFCRCDDGNVYYYNGTAWIVEFIPTDVALNTVERGNAESIWEKDIVEIEDTMPSLGNELVPSTHFADWVDSSVPDGWTKGGTHNAANYVEESSGGGLRCVSDTSAVNIFINSVLEVGKNYRASYEVTDYNALGTWVLDGTDVVFEKNGIFTVDFTATGTQLFIGRVGDAASDLVVKRLSVREILEAPTNNLVPTYQARENLLKQSEDLNTTWAGTRMVSGAANEMIANTDNQSHGYTQPLAALETGIHISGILLKEGTQDWAFFQVVAGSNASINFNVKTGEFGAISADVIRIRVLDTIKGKILLMEQNVTSTTGNFWIYPTGGNGAYSFPGDGSSVSMFASQMWMRKGTFEENTGYIKTLASAYPLTIKQETRDDFQLRHANGQVLTASGAWDFVENVDGFLMDESPSSIETMRQAGLYKSVSNDTWGPAYDDTEYYAGYKDNGSDVYYMQSSGTLSTATDTVLTTADIAEIISATGHGTNDAGTVQAPIGSDDLKPTCTLSTGAWVLNATSGYYGSSNPYKIRVEYLK